MTPHLSDAMRNGFESTGPGNEQNEQKFFFFRADFFCVLCFSCFFFFFIDSDARVMPHHPVEAIQNNVKF